MARPRSFSADTAVEAAASVFWSKGYRDTAISDLERATGLNRSSLYSAFGAKQAIFGLALRWYLRGFIGPRLAPMERPGAGPGDIERFFSGLAAFFRAAGQDGRGCLMINTIARAQLLTAATFGIWLAARVDPASAAQACDASAACIRSWHQPPAAARERKPARPAVSLTRHTARARPAPEGGGQRGQVLGPQRRGL